MVVMFIESGHCMIASAESLALDDVTWAIVRTLLPILTFVGIITPWLMVELQGDVLGAVVVCYDAVEV